MYLLYLSIAIPETKKYKIINNIVASINSIFGGTIWTQKYFSLMKAILIMK